MGTPDYYISSDGEAHLTAAIGDFSFWRGAALKYVWRAGRKPGADEREDLRKAIDCLQHELKRIEGTAGGDSGRPPSAFIAERLGKADD